MHFKTTVISQAQKLDLEFIQLYDCESQGFYYAGCLFIFMTVPSISLFDPLSFCFIILDSC